MVLADVGGSPGGSAGGISVALLMALQRRGQLAFPAAFMPASLSRSRNPPAQGSKGKSTVSPSGRTSVGAAAPPPWSTVTGAASARYAP